MSGLGRVPSTRQFAFDLVAQVSVEKLRASLRETYQVKRVTGPIGGCPA